MACEGMTSLQLLGIQLACKIVPEPQDVQDEILTDSGHKTTTTVILEGRMSFWIGRGQSHGFFNYGRGDENHFKQTLLELDEFLISLDYLNSTPTAADLTLLEK
jgi:hypothetical protein